MTLDDIAKMPNPDAKRLLESLPNDSTTNAIRLAAKVMAHQAETTKTIKRSNDFVPAPLTAGTKTDIDPKTDKYIKILFGADTKYNNPTDRIRTLMREPVALDGDQAVVSTKQAFRQGIIVNALNPKTALFFLSIFPQFIDTASDHAQLQSLFLGAIFVVLATLFNGSYSLMASGLRHLLLRGRTLPFIQRYVSGSLFVGLGLLAATAGRTK
jgi:hypothetical protein